MIKHRILKRTRKGHSQHYWVGREKTFGMGLWMKKNPAKGEPKFVESYIGVSSDDAGDPELVNVQWKGTKKRPTFSLIDIPKEDVAEDITEYQNLLKKDVEKPLVDKGYMLVADPGPLEKWHEEQFNPKTTGRKLPEALRIIPLKPAVKMIESSDTGE